MSKSNRYWTPTERAARAAEARVNAREGYPKQAVSELGRPLARPLVTRSACLVAPAAIGTGYEVDVRRKDETFEERASLLPATDPARVVRDKLGAPLLDKLNRPVVG